MPACIFFPRISVWIVIYVLFGALLLKLWQEYTSHVTGIGS